MDLTVAVGGSAMVSALFIQYLKKSNWFTFLSTEAHSQTANLIFSIFWAALTSLGITFTFNAVTHQLIINGLDPSAILTLAYHSAIQWAAQHVAYKIAVVPTEMQGKILEQLKILAGDKK